MMRRMRPWWALLTTIALVAASLMAPMEGAAYRVVTPVDPIDRAGLGEPDNPGSGRNTEDPGSKSRTSLGSMLVVQPLPGVILTVRLQGLVRLAVAASRGRR
jgi:hypothetical protein